MLRLYTAFSKFITVLILLLQQSRQMTARTNESYCGAVTTIWFLQLLIMLQIVASLKMW